MCCILMQTKEKLKKILKLSLDSFARNDIKIENINEKLFKLDINIEIPAQRDYGEFSSNISLVSAKLFKKSPRFIAENIIKYVPDFLGVCDYILKYEIAGNGFINFYMNNKFYSEILCEIDKKKENYGKYEQKNKRVLIEFVSSNPTGPMHIGNARLGALGDCLSGILNFFGYEVLTEFYVNDAGNQIQKFGESLSLRYEQIFDKNVEFIEDGYHGEDIKLLAQEFANIHGDKYIKVKSNEREKVLINYALPRNINKIKSDLERYKIFYDSWFYESELYKNNEISNIIQKLEKNNAIYRENNAIWFKATDFGGEKDEILIRTNGIPTYFAADIAYHVNKFVTRNFDMCINIWGADHHGHVARMQAAMNALGINNKILKIIIVQLVSVFRDGNICKMSKRSGQAETFASFLEEVNTDSARIIFNMQNPGSKMVFNINEAIKNDMSNPVYYVKYAYVRLKNIVNLVDNNKKKENFNNINLDLLNSPEERELIFILGMFPEEIASSSCLLDSTKITKYLINLVSWVHKFYQFKKVRSSEINEKLSNSRLFLCKQTIRIMEIIANILKIDMPEKM
ncbi:MAG: arginine--tRNA ligase [Candidatus Improbicoccus devescovinae]|nr:MAG: arginine--tRNA ligase [Candidatus Improbicoccus devescovinae]